MLNQVIGITISELSNRNINKSGNTNSNNYNTNNLNNTNDLQINFYRDVTLKKYLKPKQLKFLLVDMIYVFESHACDGDCDYDYHLFDLRFVIRTIAVCFFDVTNVWFVYDITILGYPVLIAK